MYHVKAFFEANPKAKVGFETYDHIMHPSQEIAEKWIERHAAKTVTRHANPNLPDETSEDSEGKGKVKKNGGGKPKKENAASVVTAVPQIAILEGGGNQNAERGNEPATPTE